MNRYMYDDIDDARQDIVAKGFLIFEVLRGERNNFLTHKVIKEAYRTIYHKHQVSEDTEWGINSLREEGIEVYYPNTDFGLEEVFVTRIK